MPCNDVSWASCCFQTMLCQRGDTYHGGRGRLAPYILAHTTSSLVLLLLFDAYLSVPPSFKVLAIIPCVRPACAVLKLSCVLWIGMEYDWGLPCGMGVKMPIVSTIGSTKTRGPHVITRTCVRSPAQLATSNCITSVRDTL